MVAVGAGYHISCYDAFRLTVLRPSSEQRKRGRPEADFTIVAMEEIYRHIEENGDECQFSLTELKNCVTDKCPDDRVIIKKLEEKYGDKLIISKVDGKSTLFCFRDTSSKILHKTWQTAKGSDDKEEKLKIIRTAAKILLDDIRSTPFDLSEYPPPDNFLKESEDVVPKTLMTFLEELIIKNKKDTETASRKCIAIAHAIVSAIRPRSFISPILLGLAALINQKYASKSLIDLLSSIGFCASYYEVSLFQISAIAHNHNAPEANPEFCQYVFDNADHNIRTIDGHHTFHSMGGIKCHTPKINTNNEGILRLKKIPPSFVVGNFGHVQVQKFEKCERGLKQVLIPNYAADEDIKKILTPWTDIIWFYGKKDELDVPGWNGFMEILNTTKEYSESEIVPLPFINNPPSQYETIYTSLLEAVENSKLNGHKSTIVTFDQPLYHKAKDITTSSNDPRLESVVIRLGGFHLLMSYMGSIGYMMNGSGLKELWSTVYAPSSVDKMLIGHSYSRAVRAHTLTQLSLGKIVLESTQYDDEDIAAIEDVIFNTTACGIENVASIEEKFENALDVLNSNGPTAKLWILYLRMVTLLKHFIQAERSGNWNLHLTTIKKMLPFFHAAGHFSYAKSATLYLQDMLNLANVLTPEEFNKFTEDGYFTIRRTNKFWSGIWSDMTIEQTLMRSMKSSGGLTRGRGLSDAVLTKWILATPILTSVITSVEDFADEKSSTTEQHVDNSTSRLKRDLQDTKKFDDWLKSQNPFIKVDKIMSISTGITGDFSINCYEAQKIGMEIMTKSNGNNFEEISYSRKDRVLPLAAVNTSIKVEDTSVPVEPEMMFRRIAFAKKSQDELKNYLKYELAPFPLPLFDVNGMRKCKKSAFYDLFKPLEEEPYFENKSFVIDGGYILHKVIWPRGATFSAACDQYVKYIKTNYGQCSIIVFDGYPEDPQNKGTKSTERIRRENNKRRTNCAEILFTGDTVISVGQEIFLSNSKNKQRFITLLRKKFEDNGIRTKQAEEDADTLIVQTALENAECTDSVFIVGEDIDLLVILSGSPDNNKNKVLFLKPGRNKVPRKVYTSHSFTEQGLTDHVLFMHAFSGCDTTSALFRLGKKKLVDVMKKNTSLHKYSSLFRDPNAVKESLIEAGERIMTVLYSSNSSKTCLNDIRYEMFARSITKSKFNLASLPPTSGAAAQHSLRTYCQVQFWLGERKEPKNWGWKYENGYRPVQTLDDPAPPEILSVISCKCKTSCGRNCTCKKAALNCSAICNDCHGKPCTGLITIDDDDDPDEPETVFEQMVTCGSETGQSHDSDMDEDEPIILASDDLSTHVAIDDNDKENLEATCSKRLRLDLL